MAEIASESKSGEVLAAIITVALAAALFACSASQSSDGRSSINSTAYEPPSPVARAPLPSLMDHSSSTQLSNSENPPSFASSPNSEAMSYGAWRASPRWAAIKGDGCVVVDQESGAQAGAAKFTVDRCSPKDAGELHLDKVDVSSGD